LKFCIISHVIHTQENSVYFGYAPYVREMNLWEKHIEELIIVAPLDKTKSPTAIDLAYLSKKVSFIEVMQFNLTMRKEILRTFLNLPIILFRIYKGMCRADHIHLRCPGNMGLLGTLVQILFPHKKKTAKYAGNWDWNSNQPWSYRLQQRILRNTFFTRNMQVLVYGDWNETKNIKPFFTASYSEKEIVETLPRKLDSLQPIKLIFVGGLNEGKRPKLSLEVSLKLQQQGIQNEIHFYGDGIQRKELQEFIEKKQMEEYAFLHGNVSAEIVKQAYQRSHFLVFISKSEGWPKAVAEAMFWGCLPLTSAVSCVPQMIGFGERGDIVESESYTIVEIIKDYLKQPERYSSKCIKAMEWSRQYTLEKFEEEIKELIV
jgi:glycosyltransferase involved in cell wall biosynthesis